MTEIFEIIKRQAKAFIGKKKHEIRWMQPFEPFLLFKIFLQYCSWGLSSVGREVTSTPQAGALSCAGTYTK